METAVTTGLERGLECSTFEFDEILGKSLG
jgi:hypothetical protein